MVAYGVGMLTDTEIRKAKPKQEPYRMPDAGGLFLFVTPAGGKLWRWKYRVDGKQKLMAFGAYPNVSLAEARNRHAEQRTLLASGRDPMAERKVAKAESATFATFANEWPEHWRTGKSPRHVVYVER